MANPFEDQSIPSNQPNKETPELSTTDRLIAILIFDTQPKRQAAYLKRIGFDVNPKDGNMIKPIGAPEDEYFPLDPGGMFDFKQYGKGGFKKGASEFGKDLLEGGLDFLQGAATEVGGDLAAAGETAATGGIGSLAAIPTRSAGRMATFNAIEAAKDAIGDMFLDEKIPVDYALRATQTAVQAVAPEVVSKGIDGIKIGAKKSAEALSGAFRSISNGVRNLLDVGDGQIGKQAWDALKKNVSIYNDKKAVMGSSAKIDDYIESMIGGHSRKDADFNSSSYANQMNPLQEQRVAEAANLDDQISLDVGAFKKHLEAAKYKLAQPGIKSEKTLDGIEYIDKKIAQVNEYIEAANGALPPPSGSKIMAPFSTIDKWVREIQDDLYSKKLLTKDWRDTVKGLVDGPDGLNTQLKLVADTVGSPYSQIKKKQSEIFDSFDRVSKVVDTKKARRFVLGDELADPSSGNDNTIAKEFGEAVKDYDGTMGTNIYDGLRTGQIQNQFLSSMESKANRGSGGFWAVASPAATAVGTSAKLSGAPTDLAVALGLGAGGMVGSLSNPRIGVPVAVGAENLASAADHATGAIGNAFNKVASSSTIQTLKGPAQTQVARELVTSAKNPFEDHPAEPAPQQTSNPFETEEDLTK